MRTFLILLLLPLVVLSFAGCKGRGAKKSVKDYNKPLAPGQLALREIDSRQLPDVTLTPATRADLSKGIANSLAYLAKPSADRSFPMADISKEQVVKSLHALDELLKSANSDAQFNAELKKRFRALMSVGCDDQGTVLFTGYFTPTFSASLTPDATYRFPLYKRPKDLVASDKNGVADDTIALQRMPDGSTRPYPDRKAIDSSGMLRGTELVYLADPFECYLVQVQGSAKLRLTTGENMNVGYAGTNGHPYRGIGQDLVRAGKIPAEKLSYFTIRGYFRDHPEDVATYTGSNPRYVFFDRYTTEALGSLGQPVIANVSIATDKSIFPRAAPTIVSTSVADPRNQNMAYTALRLDQDTGGGIRAAGHADLYMGEGDENERRAGAQYSEGKLYYLILRE
ncbi:MAG: MltA domain-containing protein [Planctomycetes bacterium]|nr:MltA domain-containing protein [Planctomycetota bacterium]